MVIVCVPLALAAIPNDPDDVGFIAVLVFVSDQASFALAKAKETAPRDQPIQDPIDKPGAPSR